MHRKLHFAILRRPRTQALLDEQVDLDGLRVGWHPTSDPLGWRLSAREQHRDILSGPADGGEMSIAAFVRAKAQGAPLSALPIFLKRGLAHRSLFCRIDSALVSPEELVDRRVGLVSYTSSMAVWMRGLLQDQYGLNPARMRWFSLAPEPNHSLTLKIPEAFLNEKIPAWEELDGYPHDLDRRESFLLSLLERQELDAVISFQAKIASKAIRPLLPDENSCWSHYREKAIYPINHLFVIREDILNEIPRLAEKLLSAFRIARSKWLDYLAPPDRAVFEHEIENLGSDPFAYRLGAVEKTTLDTFVAYLQRDGKASRRIFMRDLFPGY